MSQGQHIGMSPFKLINWLLPIFLFPFGHTDLQYVPFCAHNVPVIKLVMYSCNMITNIFCVTKLAFCKKKVSFTTSRLSWDHNFSLVILQPFSSNNTNAHWNYLQLLFSSFGDTFLIIFRDYPHNIKHLICKNTFSPNIDVSFTLLTL